VADRAGGGWPTRAREAALALSGEPAEDDATIKLLRDVKDIFSTADDPDVLASSVIVERLVALEDKPWREWSHGRPLSPAKLARLLTSYGIYPAGTIRIGEKTAKGYRRAAFIDAWERYLSLEGGPEASQRNSPNESGPEVAISNRHNGNGGNECDALQSVTNPMNTGRSDGVTLSGGGEGKDEPWLDL
jgi:hypothetical protein